MAKSDLQNELPRSSSVESLSSSIDEDQHKDPENFGPDHLEGSSPEPELQKKASTKSQKSESEATSVKSSKSSKSASSKKSNSSKKSSIDSEIVPRIERRGLLSQLCLIPEYRDPRNCPKKTKKLITCIIAVAAIIGPMGTSIIFPVITDVTSSLHTNPTIVNVSVGIYLLSMGIFPLWWSSISEMIGRRSVYIISFSLLLAFCIGAALSPSIGSFIVFRMLMGASSSSVQSIGSGGINDLYRSQELGRAMSLFYLGTLVAPFLSPIIGGAVGSKWGFRGTCWFMVIFAGVILVLIIIGLPETLRRQDSPEAIAKYLAQLNEDTKKFNKEKHDLEAGINSDDAGNDDDSRDIQSLASTLPNVRQQDLEDLEEVISRITTNQAQTNAQTNGLTRVSTVDKSQADKLQKADLEKVKSELIKLQSKASRKNGKKDWPFYRHRIYLFVFKPVKSVVFLRYPPVLWMLIYSAVSFMCLYFVNLSISYEYTRDPYNFSVLIVGLAYIPNSLSYILTSLFSGRWVDKLLKDFEKKHGFLSPEARISWNCYIAAILLPCSLLIMGWCWDKHTHWICPMVGTFLWGGGSLLVINTTVTYIVDSLPGRGATGVALNNLLRQTLATVACFVQEPLTKALGAGVLYSILAGILLVFGSTLIVVKKYSSTWRENYDLQKLYNIVDG